MKKIEIFITLATVFFVTPNVFAQEDSGGWRRGLPGILKKCFAYYETFYMAGQAENLPPYFLIAIAARESACTPSATSFEVADIGEHAQGLMQILPSTYKVIGVGGNPYDPYTSIWSAAVYLNRHLRPAGYNNAEQLAIGYRWGPGGANKKRGREHEQGYVQDVLFAWKIAPCVLHPDHPPFRQLCSTFKE